MIIKSFEINKIDYKENFFLFYGNNQGHKNQRIEEKFKKNMLNAPIVMMKQKLLIIRKFFLITFYPNHSLKRKN